MGYEILYHYQEETDKGVYDDEVKTKLVKVGTPYEEIPLEVVAGKIIAQLARRNILVKDVEIYEYTKKKISYKDTPDGVVIKNKKFSFDDGPVTMTEETDTSVPQSNQDIMALLAANPQILAALQSGQPPTVQPPKHISAPPSSPNVLRYEIFNPVHQYYLDEAKNKKLSFTLGKKYPIMHERVVGSGLSYTTIDDKGKSQVLSDQFFVLAPPRLVGFDEVSGIVEENTLMGGFLEDSMHMPNLRGT